MKVFECGHCKHPLFFENNHCENCGHKCGYRDKDRTMLTFDPFSNFLISDRENWSYKYCKNNQHAVCNWVLEQHDIHGFCAACQLNRTIPDLSDETNFPKWKSLEIAKHRLIYQLQKIGLSLPSKMIQEEGLCFDFIGKRGNPDIMTGHANGVITILLQEADSVSREQIRKQLQEPYRTLIGHLRHEVGHYFWERLVANDQSFLANFRTIFGNEQLNYGEALQTYYDNGAPSNWRDAFISKYATAHPWEDWAETWAHYLHVMDMVETAHFFGLKVHPSSTNTNMNAEVSFDPYTIGNFEIIVRKCMPLSFAVNSINRAMGIPDVYPFVISQPVISKMTFIHEVLWAKRG